MKESEKMALIDVTKSIYFWVAIVAIMTLLTAIRVVDTGKVGVVTSYGKVTGRVLEPGVSLVAPWWINSVTSYDVKTQKNIAKADASTKDLQNVKSSVVINYRIQSDKAREIHQTVGTGYIDVLVDPAVQEVFKATTAKYNALELINNRTKVKDDVNQGLRDRLIDRGIVIEDVSIVDLTYSPEFSKAIEDRQVAQQNAERAKYNLERAKLDAQSQDVQAKTLTDNYLKMKAIEKWDGKMPKAVGGSGQIFSIPVE